MSLQFVYGNSGFGKTKYIYEKIIAESMAHPEKKYFCIVPEQFTMQTQRDFVTMHPRNGISNIDVLSFERLAFRVLDEVGMSGRRILEETGKNMVIRKLAQQKKDELTVLGKNMKKLGYISEVKSLISELTQYQITEELLGEMIRGTADRPLLSAKLRDISLLYHAFLEYMGEEYMTSEQVLQVLNSVLERSHMLKNCVMVLDGFTAFSPVQLELLKGLLSVAEKIYLTATLDYRVEPYAAYEKTDLFYLTKKMIQSVTAAASGQQVAMEEPVICREHDNYRFAGSPELAFLEQNIFRNTRNIYEDQVERIHLQEYQSAQEEVLWTARRIRRYVREENYRFREIAVVLGNEEYPEHVGRVFKTYEIPCFLDEKRSALAHPFIEFLRALMKLLEENASYETVFRCLRTGFCGLTVQEIDLLENYVLALGIRGFKKYEQKWIRFQKEQTEEELLEINRIREKFVGTFVDLPKIMRSRDTDIREKCRAIYEFMERLQLQQQLKKREDEFTEAGDGAAAREYHRIFSVIVDLLDKYVDLMGEEKISLEEFSELLDAGFAELKLGIIPPGSDQVMVGDLERTRLKDVKILFLLGVNEGNIPKSHAGGGLLSQMERELLEERRVVLSPTGKEQVYLQKFYLYYMLTKPSKQLHLSYCSSDFHGAMLRPSYLKDVFLKLFPKLMTETVHERSGELLETEREGLEYLLELLASYDGGSDQEEKRIEIEQLMSWYKDSEEYRETFGLLLDSMRKNSTGNKIASAVARVMYGENPYYSVTRLEKYAACAYAHFLQYGLRLKERELYEFAAVDMGTLLHRAVELYTAKVEKGGYGWLNISDEIREALAQECVSEVITDYKNTVLFDNARNEYMISRMERLVKRAIWALTEQLKNGFFEPEKQETPFFLSNGEISLQGRIDRIDTLVKDDRVYLRVMDYKSGSASFDLTALYNGLQLQLAVYFNAARMIEKRDHPGREIVPAGLFYFPIKDPLIDFEEQMGEEEISQGILKELALKGVVNADPEIIHLMDKTCAGKSRILPVTFNKDGTLGRNSSAMTTEGFEKIGKFVEEKVESLGREIMEGKIAVNPYGAGQRTACDYCPYHGICGFSPKENSFRRLEKCQWE